MFHSSAVENWAKDIRDLLDAAVGPARTTREPV
jgi:hypothetical protein